MKSILFLLLLLFTSSIPVSADGFSERGDNSQNNFYHTITYTIDKESLPLSSEEEDSIQYMDLDVVGENSKNFISNIYSLTKPYHMIRLNSKAINVAVPPLSKIDIIYHYLNNSGHTINVSKIKTVYSRELSEDSGVSFIKNDLRLTRNGHFIEYAGMGEVKSGESGVKFLDTVKIDNPLSILEIKTSKGEGDIVNLMIRIRNSSGEELKNLQFFHREYITKFDLSAYREYELNYSLKYPEVSDNSVDLGYFTLFNPNTFKRCAVFGTALNEWFNVESVSVFSYREDGGWAHGSYLQPDEEGFCIERVPYSMTSKRIFYEKGTGAFQNEVKEGGDVSVLGVASGLGENFILPKTGVFNPFIGFCGVMLLVVDIFLWYSVLERKRNEKKYIFAKLCTKSWKDTPKRRV